MFQKRIRPAVTDELRGRTPDRLLDFYDEEYFEGRRYGDVLGYHDYADCRWILDAWSGMLEERFKPESLLDVGAAYGFVVDFFRSLGTRADGVEPSPFARRRAVVDLIDGSLPDDLPVVDRPYEVVACTEVLEHVRPEQAPSALDALGARSTRKVVCLVEMGDWDAYHDDPSHIHLRPREWWRDIADGIAGTRLNESDMSWLDAHPISERIGWRGRFLVLDLVPGGRG